jgi:adenosine deaminase
MFEAGLKTTLNTDDPSVSRITLTHEYQRVGEDLKVPMNVLEQCVINAAQAAFIAEKEKEELVTGLKQELKM